jgi:hypothetical protein
MAENKKHVQTEFLLKKPTTPMPIRAENHASGDIHSKTVKERIQLALKAIDSYGLQPNGQPEFSLREAAKAYLLSKSTLTGRCHGGKTQAEAHEKEQKLTPGQEMALVEWIKEMGRRGVPLDGPAVMSYASMISGQEIGNGWIVRFRERHPELKAKWTRGLEKCRAQVLNATAVERYFAILVELIEKYNIPVGNIYNMDEKGIQLGVGRAILALVDRDQKQVYHLEDGNRELVTMIECVCADA